MTNLLTAPLLPEIVRYHVNRETHKLVALNQVYWVVVGLVVNGGVLLCYPMLPWLYGHWTAHNVGLDNRLLSLLLAGLVLYNVGALMASHLNGINSLRIVLAVSVVRATLCLGGGALGYGSMGLAGLGMGILAGEFFAVLMTVRYFMVHELTRNGREMPTATLASVALSAGSAVLFLLSVGMGWVPGGWGWFLSLAGVAVGSTWGWITLDQEVRRRLLALATQRYRSN